MSILRKVSSYDKLVLKNGFLTISAYYSRRSKEEFESYFKVITSKSNVRVQTERSHHLIEGGPNWEIFNPRGNRFYLPNSSGPGWQSPNSTFFVNVDLDKLIDFDSLKSNKLHISIKQCPVLIRKKIQDLFPVDEVFNEKKKLNLIILSYTKEQEIDAIAKNFVVAAQEICKRLHMQAYWADFWNPFSGKPFYNGDADPKLAKIDKRFRGFGVKFEDKNNCTVIRTDVDGTFSGCIFTDAPDDRGDLKWIIQFPREE